MKIIECKDGGTLTEVIREPKIQVTTRVIPPGATAGGHFHPTMDEYWVVVSGTAMVRYEDKAKFKFEMLYDGERPSILQLKAGWGHEIENIGDDDVVLIFWHHRPWEPNDNVPWKWEPVIYDESK